MTTPSGPRIAPSPLPGFYADPALVVVDGEYWLYPTTDGSDMWAATSFRAFSSPDLAEWTPRGEVLRLGSDVAWCDERAWAPAVAERDGTFFFYFTAGGDSIGVASGPTPTGPFVDSTAPIVPAGAFAGTAIDPSVFHDDDGTRYLLWGNGVAHLARLNDDMTSFDAATVVSWVPTGFREAISLHRRRDRYYASWSENDTREPDYRVRYATASALTGPWTDHGVLIEQNAAAGSFATGHHCVTRVPGTDDWVIAYHRFARDRGNGYRREIVFDALTHRADGLLEVVHDPTGFTRPLRASGRS